MTIRTPRRRGTLIPIVALALVGLFAFTALAIDLGLMMVARPRFSPSMRASPAFCAFASPLPAQPIMTNWPTT